MTASRILVVDDEGLGRELLVRTLGQYHFEVRGASSGAEAFQIIESGGVSLLISDFVMPEMDGVELCRLVRSHPDPMIAATPIVMLTGFSGDDQEITCLKAGADDFVTKPINAAVLRARIETHLRLREMRGQLEEQNRKLEASQAEIERDLEAARLTQQAILPQRDLRLPGWSMATHYQPVIQVGGDIYDWLGGNDGAIYFWISDATGHGASAALMTALAKSLFRNAVELSPNPVEIVREVNRAFRAVFRGRFLLTAMCARLDPNTGELTIAGAGHPPALLIHPSAKVEMLESCWPPLGIAELDEQEPHHTTIGHGDRLVLWTDGFFGMAREDGSRVGLDEVVRIMQSGTPGPNWIEGLLQSLRRLWNSETPWPDDLAMVTLARN